MSPRGRAKKEGGRASERGLSSQKFLGALLHVLVSEKEEMEGRAGGRVFVN